MESLNWVYLFTGLFLAWCLIIAAYNVFLHPLRNYPGPKLDAATRLVYVYHMILGDSCKYLASLHDKYGEVVRVGPNELSYTTVSANKTIFGTKATADSSFEKNPAVYIQGSGMSQNILFASTSEHPRYRRLMGPAFSEQAIREQEPMIQEFTSTMIETLRHNRSGKAYFPSEDSIVNIGAWSIFFTFDVFSALSFGEPIGCIATADYHPWAHVIFGAMKHATFLQCAYRLKPYHRILEKLIPREISAPMEEHMEYSRAFMERTGKDEKFSRASFSSFILKGMNKDELFDNINILATAGSETTATAISSIFYYLTHNPDSYQRLVDEVRSAFTSEHGITFNSTAKLKYLNAVIKETLRIHPSVPVGLHRITPEAGSYIDGQWVPGGTWVSVALLAAYRSPRYWHRPEEFIPERWLGDPEFESDNRAIWAPWSIGPRKCIGINLAYLNMRLITVRLLWNFDFEAQPDNLDPHELHEFGVWQGQAPLNLKMRDARTSAEV
ncbi:hypothetical protein N7448_000109 [Penicillium atrosanguineum]|uniref:Uncharacterized protein n=1 Tax=Penicillium atrosanguineum TaxID=1132637 RepID=A0A9W9Q2E9_9EURO|nr:uncharacterized protein N7443_003510 [Penicillium atrosanguineum]KAJ5148531.1 hypothetical protein N7448_000109 [Penicillium atrosanguineum]KAJ5303850.1 hypothetical protein N7443_003510 [Penicillium atrosanguineum]KAJ5323325.1 hypothetical protein N7476_001925 [Penicillium atrosanguineum]